MTTKPDSLQVLYRGTPLQTVIDNLQSQGAVSAGAVGFTPTTDIAATNVQNAIVELATEKQNVLVSGTSIKTINGTPILGSGNIVISGGGGGASTAAGVSYDNSLTDVVGTNVQDAITNLAATRQVKLVAGSTLKTINGATVLGSGDVTVGAKSFTDFGAVGDDNPASAGVNGVALAGALNYIATTGKSVYVPQGYYYLNPFSIYFAAYIQQAGFFGDDRERTVFKRAGTGGTPFVTIGAQNSTVFQSGLQFRNIGFNGGAVTNGPTVVMYDIVRSSFYACKFTGGDVACQLFGGISLNFSNCLFEQANFGLKIDKFSSSAGGGWPNAISVTGGEAVDNRSWGIWFDAGRLLTVSNIDIEGNGIGGSAGSPFHGGAFVGPSVGQEVNGNGVVADNIQVGAIFNECWFEANIGTADLLLQSGSNTVRSSLFYSGPTTNDIRIDGGRYTLTDIDCSVTKAQNVLETAGTTSGNIISGCQIPSLAQNGFKTTLLANNRIFTNGGEAAIGIIPQPLIQAGADFNVSGTYIAFPQPYSQIPAIVASPWGGASNELLSVKITGATTAGFTLHKSYNVMSTATVATNDVLSNSPYAVVWIAFGQKA